MVTEMAMRGEPWRRQEQEEHAEADMELDLFRSGSAPPTVEGSMGALHGAGADVFLKDDLLADPTYYHSYYYSNGNFNPRLLPPLLSKEDWRSAQQLRTGLGGIDDGRKPRGGGGGGGSGRAGAGDGLIGMPGLEIGRQQSFSGIFQDDSYQHDTDGLGANSNSTDLLDSSRVQYGLRRETGAIGGLHSHNKASCLSVNQNNESSHTYASIIGSSLSRNASPDPELMRRVPSPCLPPIGVKLGATDKNNGGSSSFNRSSSSLGESGGCFIWYEPIVIKGSQWTCYGPI